MVGVFIRMPNGNFRRVSYANTKLQAKVKKKELERANTDKQYVIQKLNWR